MQTKTLKLLIAIQSVCPAVSVDSNRRIAFKKNATIEQRAAAQKIASEFDFDGEPEKPEIEILRERIAALEQQIIGR